MRPVQKHEVKRLVETMTMAFFDDPLTAYMEPDESKRLKKAKWFMSVLIGYCLRWGEVYADDKFRGGSTWLGPGNTNMTTLRGMRAGFWQMPFRLGLGALSRFSKLDSVSSKIHKAAAPGDHWYLLGLGTHPDHQGTGIGSAAIEVGTAKADEAGLPVYLETMTPENVDYYSKRGFEVAGEATVEGAVTVKVWGMLRQPR